MTIRVLLADDHTVVRDGLRLLLENQEDIQVIGAVGNGNEAVRESLESEPNVVIMDIAMPELDGLKAAEMILKEKPEIRLIILSMYATREHILQAFQSGACGYLLKDSAGSEVVQAVRTVMSGEKYLSASITERILADYVTIAGKTTQLTALERLSERERQVFAYVVDGKSSAEVAELLYLSPKTVETYRRRIMEKLGVHDLAGLIKFAAQHGLIAYRKE
ncbi:MAG: response regulator [Chloroflexota bacterium]